MKEKYEYNDAVETEKQCGYPPPHHSHSGICRKIHILITVLLHKNYVAILP